MKKVSLSRFLITIAFALSILFSLTVFTYAKDSLYGQENKTDEYLSDASSSNERTASLGSYRPQMSITLNADFELNVYIPVKNTLNFTFDGIFYENAKNYEETKNINGVLYYKLTKALPAPEAAREIKVSATVDFDGIERVGNYVFSIPKYARAVLNSSYSEIDKMLVKNALHYIAGAYTYFESENAEEVLENISETIGSHKGCYAIRSIDAKENTGILGAAFVLDSKPGIKFYIDGQADKNSYKFFANNRDVDKVTEGYDSDGRYLFVSLSAYRMCGTVTYTVDGVVAGSYGIGNYYSYVSKSAYTDDKKEELRDLLRRFYNYSTSAADYFIEFHDKGEGIDSITLENSVIIYPKNASSSLIEGAEKLALLIGKTLGYTPSVVSDETQINASKRIYVGSSQLVRSYVSVKLERDGSDDAFILEFDESEISILGKTEKSTLRAIKYFVDGYVNRSFDGIISLPDGSSVIKPFMALENGSEAVVESVSTVFGVVPGIYEDGIYPSYLSKSYYPSVIELKHNGENNGKLIAILAVNDTPAADYKHLDTNACVMESSDGGITWKMISRPQETINPTFTSEDGKEYSIQGISMAHIYELPAKVGDMPAGTLLYSGTSVNYDCYSQVAIWRSFDCGYTWEEYTVVATGGGLREGVWEPFTWYEESDGYLYCFYSDDSDPLHDQKLVFKRSKDGVNWSNEVGVCVFNAKKARPGMLIMTQMGSGEYFMVYEYFGGQEGKIYYKITDDITDWDPNSPGTLLKAPDGYTFIGGPSCIWTEAGGKNGTLIVSGKTDTDGGERHLLFVSHDYGRSWTTMENPLPYDRTLDVKETNRVGHSASFIVSSDPSVIYYLNTTVSAETGYQRVQCAKIKIYE